MIGYVYDRRGEPPYVVQERLEDVFVSSWPGRLLRVRTVGELDTENVRPEAGYARAQQIEVLEEVDVAVLFGPRGAAVAEVIERAAVTDPRTDPHDSAAYTRAWNRWLAAERPHRDHTVDQSFVLWSEGSPVGHGLSLVASALRENARAHGGVGVDDEGEEVLIEPWRNTVSHLLDEALRAGAPELYET